MKKPFNLLSIIIIKVIVIVLIGGGIFFFTSQSVNGDSDTKVNFNNLLTDKKTEQESEQLIEEVQENKPSEIELSGCDAFSDKLDACEPFSCEFEHPFTDEMMEKEVMGLVNGKCQYTEEMPNNGRMDCEYTESMRKAAAQYYRDVDAAESVGTSLNADLGSGDVETIYTIDGKKVENPLQEAMINGQCVISGYDQLTKENNDDIAINNITENNTIGNINLEVNIPKEKYQVGESLNNSKYSFKYTGGPFSGLFLFYKTSEGLAEGLCSYVGQEITSDGNYNLENWGFLEDEKLDCNGNYVYSIAVYDSSTIDTTLGDEEFEIGEKCQAIWEMVSPLKVVSKRITVNCSDESIDCCQNWAYRCDYFRECQEEYRCVQNRRCVRYETDLTEEIAEWVSSAIKSSMSEEKIFERLSSHGYTEKEIENAIMLSK